MPMTTNQITLISQAHARGLTDAAIARHGGVSLSSVKRPRTSVCTHRRNTPRWLHDPAPHQAF